MALRILFLYNHNWDKEIRDFRQGTVPSHRLFGLAGVEAAGHQAFTCPKPNYPSLFTKKPFFWRIYQAIFAALHQNRIDCIVATHEASALPVLLLKCLGLLRTPVVVMNVALLHPKQCVGLRKWLWKQGLPCAEAIVSYASAQLEWLMTEFSLNHNRLFFIPLGVDTRFFAPVTSPTKAVEERQGFCLSVGTNDGKDYRALIKALPDGIKLIIVTDHYNKKIINKYLNGRTDIDVRHDIPIDHLRTLYQEASLQIIPLLNTRFSSGQTVLLENMALGKAVVVSRTAATSDYVEDGVTALVIEANDVETLRQRVAEVFKDPQRREQIGAQASEKVRSCFSSERFSQELISVVEHAITAAKKEPLPEPN